MSENAGITIWGRPIRGRSCGSCQLCCTLLPVELADGNKPANERCKHVCSKGCGIYENRPPPCRWFNCRWLFDPDTAPMRRPDRVHYVIDPMLDTIIANNQPIEVLQVWVDPRRRDAHRDPALRAYLAKMAEKHGVPAIIRYGSTEGFVLVAPPHSADGEWLELHGIVRTQEHMQRSLAELGATPAIESQGIAAEDVAFGRTLLPAKP
jgi:hypothetical protein